MGNKHVQATLWQSTAEKVLPLAMAVTLILFINPKYPILQNVPIEVVWGTIFWSYIGLAFFWEMMFAWPDRDEKGNFGVPLLAILGIAGLGFAILTWFRFYEPGSDQSVDSAVTLYLFICIVLLGWQARVQIFKRKRLKLSILSG